MVPEPSLLVALVALVEQLPLAPPPARGRGRPRVDSDRLFLKALVIMIVRHLPNVHLLLTVLDQSTAEMEALQALLTEQGRYPTRRTWERRLRAVPPTLPAQIGCLGEHLVELLDPCRAGRAAGGSGAPPLGTHQGGAHPTTGGGGGGGALIPPPPSQKEGNLKGV